MNGPGVREVERKKIKLDGKLIAKLESLKKHVDFLSGIYTLELEKTLPMPVNTRAVIRDLESLLEIAETNSLLAADPITKTLALGYVLILVSHCLDTIKLGCSFFDPQTLIWIGSDKPENERGDLESFAIMVKHVVDDLREVIEEAKKEVAALAAQSG